MDAYQTVVGPNARWDKASCPERPPAEVVLVLSSHTSIDAALAIRIECVTFLDVTAVHPFKPWRQIVIGYVDLEDVGADTLMCLSDMAMED